MILDLWDPKALDAAVSGGKGSQLAQLISENVPVPPGFVITTEAFTNFLKRVHLDSELEAFLDPIAETPVDVIRDLSVSVQERIRASVLPDALFAASEERLQDYDARFGPGTLWAVRSSAVAEDLASASFAGQYDTLLGLCGGHEVAEGVLHCWASVFNLHAILYRRDLEIRDYRTAVVVQRLVPADVSGVCFTLDPVSGDREKVVINANFGLGDSVVSGQVTPDALAVDKKTMKVVSRHIGSKKVKTVPASGGTATQPVEEQQQKQPALTNGQAVSLASLVMEIERDRDGPVDVEWALFEETLYVLQARAVTTLATDERQVAEGPPEDWVPEMNTPVDPLYPVYSNGNISEVLPGCITPLSWSYIGPLIEHSFLAQGIALGAMEASGSEYRVVGFFYHRLYICVSYMMAAAEKIPGLSPDAIHEEFIGPLDARTSFLSLSDLLPDRWPRFIRVAGTFLTKLGYLEQDVRRCVEMTNGLRRVATEENLKEWSDQRLVEAVRFSESRARVSDVHIWASSFAVMGFSILRMLTRSWLNDGNGALAAQLVTGIGTLPSADPAFGIYELAQVVVATPSVSALFDAIHSNTLLLETLKKEPGAVAFRVALDAFLKDYGHRAVCEAEFRNPCWREDPGQVLGLARNYLKEGISSPSDVRHRQRLIRADALRRIKGLPYPKYLVMHRLVRATSRHIAFREQLKDLVVLLSDRARTVYGEIRSRLMARGHLGDPDDMYFLVWQEVHDLLTGRLGGAEARAIVSRRRQDFEWSSLVQLPKILRDSKDFTAGLEEEGTRHLEGMGVSPGKVEGRARVILDPREDSHIEPGEILVAPVTDAGWTPLFVSAGGLIVEVGGLLSHGSVVAREYGLPAVVGVAGATTKIKTGDRIYLDGNAGVVVLRDQGT